MPLGASIDRNKNKNNDDDNSNIEWFQINAYYKVAESV